RTWHKKSIDLAMLNLRPSQATYEEDIRTGLNCNRGSSLSARGDIIPTLSPNPPAAAVGGFTWNYSTNVTVDEMVTHGDFFTIYDFGNFLAGSNLQPLGWTFSSALVGT